jgi:hypothetical protein
MMKIKGIKAERMERKPFKMPTLEEMLKEFGGGPPPGAPGEPPGMGAGAGTKTETAVYINNGKYVPGESKKSIVQAGKIGDKEASGLVIKADGGYTGGVYVKGEATEYTVSDSEIELSGNGSGLGGMASGACCDDHSTLILKNVRITTNGVARCASAAESCSTLKAYGSRLTAHGAPFDSVPKGTTGPNMMTPPAALEIEGNCRTHVTVKNSYSYFYDSTIIADGWAALSTDASEGFVRLEANRCKIKTVKSGYGTYADGMCHNFFNDCDFESACMAAIAAGESDITFDRTKAKCGTYFAMIHCVMGMPVEVTTLKITGCDIKCESPGVLIKSQNAIIDFDGTKINSKSGILVKSIFNDDPNATRTKGQKVYGIHALFKNMDATGDIIHEDPDRTMTVYLESANLKGAIKDAQVSFDTQSKWTASGYSRVTLVGEVDPEQIDAPKGVTIVLTATESGLYNLASGGVLVVRHE